MPKPTPCIYKDQEKINGQRVGTCVLMASAMHCQSIPLININILILDPDSRSTLDQQLVNSQPSLNRPICIDLKLVDYQPTADRASNEMFMECWSSIKWGIDKVEGPSRVSIDTWPSTQSTLSTQDPENLIILQIALFAKVIPLQLFLNHSQIEEEKKGIERTNPVIQILNTHTCTFIPPMKVSMQHACNHFPQN